MKELSNTVKEGIILVNKASGPTSFQLVRILRKRLNVKKIGHAGTLDPLASGVMVMLVGRNYTKLSDQFLQSSKSYSAIIKLGEETDSYDSEGVITKKSDLVPEKEEIIRAISQFQGEIKQTPPMFSAKKVNGEKLYDLARKGETIERKSVNVTVETTLIDYNYPYLKIDVSCSKGTYIRSIAHDLGQILNCGAHLDALVRTKSGKFTIDQCISWEIFNNPSIDLTEFLLNDDNQVD